LRPDRCADVGWHEPDSGLERASPEVGDVVWDPKMVEGHVLNAEARCSWAPCGAGCDWLGPRAAYEHIYATCECGGYDPVDHHTVVVERHPYVASVVSSG
jgi:hypothetical protein